ncbi:MAG: PAS domain S-box protein [Thiogranum sp.]|nr:PAS domain S-box protein [Thiogranum sp.]
MDDVRDNPVARLLVVEDELLVAEDLRQRLENLRYEVVGVTNSGRQALEMVEAVKPDLVLIDGALGGEIEAVETAAKIRYDHSIPVIFVAECDDVELLERAGRLEPFGYIVKPVRSGELRAVVSMALYRNRLEQQLEDFRWGAGVCDHLSDGIIAVDREGLIAYLNDAARQLLTGAVTAVCGMRWQDDWLLTTKPLDLKKRIQGVLDSADRDVIDEDIRIKGDVDERVLKVQLIPIDARRNKTPGVAIVLQDVTEQRISSRAVCQLQAIYDASPDMVFLHDPTGKLIDVNRNALDAYGCTRDELLDLSVAEISGRGCTQEMADAALARAMAGEPVDIDWTVRWSDGTEAPAEVRLRRLEGSETDAGSSVIAVVRDLSGRARDEQALRQERDFSAAVLNTIGSVVVVLDRTGKIIRYNEAAQAVSGYAEREVLGKYVWDFLLRVDQREGVLEAFQTLVSGGFPSRYENTWITRTGEERLLAWNNTILQNADGEVEFVIGTAIDITRQRRVERDLLNVEMQWNEVIDFLAEAVYLVDLDDKVVRANKAFYELTGKSPADVVGRNIVEIMHPGGERLPCPVCAARTARKDALVVMEADHPGNPAQLPLEISLRIIRDAQGEPQGTLMGLRDLTQQRKIEAELRQHRDNLENLVQQRTAALENANRELEAFSYSVSHDLRAPLRGIDGFSQALLDEYSDQIDEVGQDYLHRVRRASQRLGILIDDLLELSRVGRNQLECRQVNLSRVAASVLKELQEGEPEQQLSAEIESDVTVCGDPVLLRLMMQNLLGNAWKFTSVRQVSEIRFGVQVDEAGERVLFVADNGVGFDMTYSSKLFGAFQRLHTGQEFEGTGVGLATVHRIIHRHEGEIWAESKVNEGATFYFTLPDEHCR